MEYDVPSLERKLCDATIQLRVTDKPGDGPKNIFFYCSGITTVNDGVSLCGNVEEDMKNFYIRIHTNPLTSTHYPRAEIIYWLPEPGIYRIRASNSHALLTRKRGKFFKLGLNTQAYRCIRLSDGDAINPLTIDLHTPILPGNSIWTRDIYVQGKELRFRNCTIGLVEKEKIWLDEPTFVSFLPNWVLDKWRVNY